MAHHARARAASASAGSVNARLESLTTRERQVMDLVLAGKYNKVIADELGISMRTVEVHRANLFDKMGSRPPWNSPTCSNPDPAAPPSHRREFSLAFADLPESLRPRVPLQALPNPRRRQSRFHPSPPRFHEAFMSEHIHYVTDDTFDSEVLQSPSPCWWITGRSGAAPAK